jgi:hypothetical protein
MKDPLFRLRKIQSEVYQLHKDMIDATGGYDKLSEFIIQQSKGKKINPDPTLKLAADTYALLNIVNGYWKYLKDYDDAHRNPKDPHFIGNVGNLAFFGKGGWPPKFKARKVR